MIPQAPRETQLLDAQVRSICQRYPNIGRILSATPVPTAGFSGARVWRMTAEHGEFALRATSEQQVNLARLSGLHRFLDHLHAAGLTEIPVPVQGIDGRSWQRGFGTIWQLEPWQKGCADFHEHPSSERLCALMNVLARCHRAASTFVARAEEAPWFFVATGSSPAVRERRQQIDEYTPAVRNRIRDELQRLRADDSVRSAGLQILELYERVAPQIARELDAARDLQVPLQPCLRDCWHDHVLFDGNRITGLIDPHACRSDNIATDLSRLLRSLLGSNRAAWDQAMQVYEQLRPLTLIERGLIEILDRSGVLLSGMTWLNWVFLEKRNFPDRERVSARLQNWTEQIAQTFTITNRSISN